MPSPLITTVIPTYRCPKLLKKAIQSILNQTYSHFHLYICDDASGDETAHVVDEFVKKDSRITYICHEKNKGLIRNYEFGLSLVKTDFFSFLSHDDVLLPNFYETMLQEFQKYPEAGFVAGSTILMKADGRVVRVPLNEWSREGKFDPSESVLEMVGKYPVPTSVLFRKKVLEYVSLDLENPLLWDPDYLLQIASIFPIVISKKPTAIFLHHDASFSNSQSLAMTEKAFDRLITRIQNNKNLPPEIAKKSADLNRQYLSLYRRSFFIYFLKIRNFEEASRVAHLLAQHPEFKNKSFFYSFLVRLLKIFPQAIYGVYALRLVKRLLKSFKRNKYEQYAHYLNNDF